MFCFKGNKFVFLTVFSIVLMFIIGITQAKALMSSDNFRIWADTVDSGGNRSSSGNFIIQDSVSETTSGEIIGSASFLSQTGLPAIFEEPVMIMNVSSGTLTLNPSTISSASTSAGSYTITTSTNAPFGYTVRVTEDGEFRNAQNPGLFISDVIDGAVTTGFAEYGIGITGADAAFANDRAVSNTPLIVATNNSFVTNSSVIVTHRASVSDSVSPGTFSHTVTYVAIGNY